MGYQPKEVAKMIGITPGTLKVWELQKLIPKARRIGLNQRRIWHQSQVKQILEYAEGLGYIVPYLFEEVNSEAKEKSSYQRRSS